MRFSIYGRFQIDIRRDGDCWVAYRVDLGKRRRVDDLVIPGELRDEEMVNYLDAFFHELARPGERVEQVEEYDRGT